MLSSSLIVFKLNCAKEEQGGVRSNNQAHQKQLKAFNFCKLRNKDELVFLGRGFQCEVGKEKLATL